MLTNRIVQSITHKRNQLSDKPCLLTTITGIDGSGKTFLSKQVVEELRQQGLNAILLHLDEWHNPAHIRFSESNPAENFYRQGLRFDELFELLVLPLKRHRALHLEVELLRVPEETTYQHTYDFADVEIILLEGIFMLQKKFREHFDWSVWIDCSFETALERALERNQEHLSQADIIRDYHRIYFPAQQIHFERDAPRAFADEIIPNDHRLISGDNAR
ncbi:MAG: uridine kinase [Acidobacteriota bacterium]